MVVVGKLFLFPFFCPLFLERLFKVKIHIEPWTYQVEESAFVNGPTYTDKYTEGRKDVRERQVLSPLPSPLKIHSSPNPDPNQSQLKN